MNLHEKLLSKREIKPSPDGRFQDCWWWTGSKGGKNYGRIDIENKNCKVHRISASIWLDFDLNSKLLICHKCDNRLCFNPEHLFVGTNQDNVRDMYSKGRNTPKQMFFNAKTNKIEANQIRDLYLSGRFYQYEIGEFYNLSQQAINKITNNQSWQ